MSFNEKKQGSKDVLYIYENMSSTLKTKATGSSEMFGNTSITQSCGYTQDHDLKFHSREKKKIKLFFL
jgi:hypothetical protein